MQFSARTQIKFKCVDRGNETKPQTEPNRTQPTETELKPKPEAEPESKPEANITLAKSTITEIKAALMSRDKTERECTNAVTSGDDCAAW